MTNIRAHSNTNTNFSFTKLLVDDLEQSAEFYKSVCGLVEKSSVESTISEYPISEITLFPADADGSPLTLLKFLHTLRPSRGEVILGFTTSDIDAFIARVKTAGGRLVDPVRAMPKLKCRVAFVEDTEGHLIEVVQAI